METGKKVYFTNLDGLRAIAALAVILFHIEHRIGFPNSLTAMLVSFDSKGGKLGVQFFFILSGFLITYLLFEEQQKKGVIHIGLFYMRRILRIWPAYYISIIIGFIIYPMFTSQVAFVESANAWYYVFFLTNFDHIYNGPAKSGILGVQWSVAVEEQFYLLWPVLFYYFNRMKVFPIMLCVFIVASERYYFHYLTSDEGKYHFFSSFRFLAYGCLLAYFSFNYQELVQRLLGYIKKPLTILIYVVSLPVMLFNDDIPNLLFNESVPFLFFGFVILDQNYSENSFFKMSRFKVLSWLGRISYGLYLYHMIAIYLTLELMKGHGIPTWVMAIVAVLNSVLIAFLSYRFLEKPFLRLKEQRFSLKN